MSNKLTLNYSLTINYMIVIYAFLLPLSRAGIGLLTVSLIVLWFAEGNLEKKFSLVLKSKVILALFIFFLFNIISVFWTDQILETLQYIKKYWYFLPVLVIFTSLKKEYITQVLSAFILGMCISEILSYGVFFEVWEYKHATPENPSPFMHHIEYSIFLAFTALLLLSRLFNEEALKYKFLYLFFFMTISGNLFLTAGRTGQFAFILGLFVLAMISFKNRIKALSVSFVLTMIILGIAFNFSDTFYERVMTTKTSLTNVIEKQNYCSSWGGRIGTCIVAKDIMVENPILGVGIIDNMTQFHTLIDTKYPEMKCMQEFLMHMHNQILQIFTQLGLIGLIIFLSIFFMVSKLSFDNIEYRNIKYIYLTVLLFSFVSEVIFHRQFSMALFTLVVGLLLAQHRIENEI